MSDMSEMIEEFKDWINNLSKPEKEETISKKNRIYAVNIKMDIQHFNITKTESMFSGHRLLVQSIEYNYCYYESFEVITKEKVDEILSKMYKLYLDIEKNITKRLTTHQLDKKYFKPYLRKQKLKGLNNGDRTNI